MSGSVARGRWGRRTVILLLFAALVAALLWFQGILFRREPEAARVPGPERVAAGARTARVVRERVAVALVHPGFVEAVDPAAIAPRVMAALLDVNGREGDRVEAGDTLVVLDDRDALARLAQARAALAGAEAQAVEARLARERAERLRDASALTEEAWERARAAHDAATAQVERASGAVDEALTVLSWFRLEAPFAGRVLARHADPGQLATPGRAVLELYRADALRFRVAVPEERASALAPGAACTIEFDRLPARTATLARVLPAADPATGTVTLHLALAPAEDLRPGLLGRLALPVGEREALLVPAAAVERIGQIERVRLVRDGGATRVTVRTGKAHGERVEVLSGLAEGEEVLLP